MKAKCTFVIYRLAFICLLVALVATACNLSIPFFGPSQPQPSVGGGGSSGGGGGGTGGSSGGETGGTGQQPSVPLVSLSLSGPKAGTTLLWTDGSLLVYVPPGEFTMGGGGEDNPKHTVYLDGFWIYRNEVTNRQYAQCVMAGKCTPPAKLQGVPDYRDPSVANYPVLGVTWDQANAYCRWMNGYLPTEAQWEKTARSSENRLYPWGEQAPNCNLLNFADCGKKPSNVLSHPQGMSLYKALDMAGNAFEWVNDWYDPRYYTNSPSKNPPGPSTGEKRVVRGGSYKSPPDELPSYRRFFLDPKTTRDDVGFRCVLVDPQPFAPLCMMPSFVPGETGHFRQPDQGCQAPDVSLHAAFCSNKIGGFTLDTSSPLGDAGDYTVTVNGEGANCSIVDGRLACTGAPSDTLVSVTVCSACETEEIPFTSAGGGEGSFQPQCLPSYSPDGENHCQYSPASAGSDGSCPQGQIATDIGCLPDTRGMTFNPPGGTTSELPCPPGFYYDDGAEMCVPVGGEEGGRSCYGVVTELDAPEECYPAGCPEGSEFNPELQCCTVPGGRSTCPPGYYYDVEYQTCLPGDEDYPSCPPPYFYDPEAGTCVLLMASPCGPGQFYNANSGGCETVPANGECPSGYVYDESAETCIAAPGALGALGGGSACTTLSVAIPNCDKVKKDEGLSCPANCWQINNQATCNACGCTWSAGECY